MVWRLFCCFLYYNLGPVVIRLRFAAPRQEPRDDIENKKNRPIVAVGLSLFIVIAKTSNFARHVQHVNPLVKGVVNTFV